MKRTDLLLLGLLALLAIAVAVSAARVATRYEQGGGLRAEWSRTKLTQLTPEMERRLAGLDNKLVFTYYVSSRFHMPSGMKRIERDVTDLLGAVRAAAPDKVDVHIVDPDTDPGQKGYASNRRIAPFRVRDVAHDAWSERLVWSTLTLAWGARDEIVINGVTPERLPRLQATLLEHLNLLEKPRRPTFALAVPEGFSEVATGLAEHGDVVLVDLDGGGPFPDDADVLFWMRPRAVTPGRLRELDRFLSQGKSVVVAGSLLHLPWDGVVPLDPVEGVADLGVRVEPSGEDLEPLLSHFGLKVEAALVLDSSCNALVNGEEHVPAPFLVRCIAPNQSFLTWSDQPNGHLYFHAATPLGLEPGVLRDLGFEARVHATTSDDAWLQPPPYDAPRPFAALSVEHGQPSTKLPLMVSLEPADPWHGRLIAFGAATPFEDGIHSAPGNAHGRLLRTLVTELTSHERLVAAATVGTGVPLPAPELSGGERFVWRVVVIGGLPLLLGLVVLTRGVVYRRRSGVWTRLRAASGIGGGRSAWLGAALAILVALALARLTPAVRIDATEGNVNLLAGESRDIARRAGLAGPVKVELFFSERAKLPPALRGSVRAVRASLREFGRAGAEFDVHRIDIEGLGESERAALEQAGIAPLHVTTRDDEVTTVRTIYSALRLSRGERTEVLPFEDAASFELLEFRLAFALWRLETGRAVKVAFAADAERMSAAEDYDLQQKGLFAPKGNDPYSLARGLLFRLDFDVVNVTPRRFVATRAPEIPDDADLLVWMQPRRSIEAMMNETVPYLVSGGNVLIAAQHFKILSRQYRGREFQMSYWPRPQTPDIDQIYLPEIGVHLVRDVLFDELAVETTVDTHVIGRTDARDYERQLSTRPFQLRVAASNFDAESPVTRNLGDQAFLFGARINLDRDRLDELGLRAKVLMTTTERTWTFPWKGGFLEEPDAAQEHLAGPPRGPDGAPRYQGKLPLAVEIEGRFPMPEEGIAENPESAPGRLVLIGCSSAFQDERLHLPDFRADRLLVNAVASLALEPELAAIATRHPSVRGFGYVEPKRKLWWRSIVVAAPPFGVFLLGLGVVFVRRRQPVRRRT